MVLVIQISLTCGTESNRNRLSNHCVINLHIQLNDALDRCAASVIGCNFTLLLVIEYYLLVREKSIESTNRQFCWTELSKRIYVCRSMCTHISLSVLTPLYYPISRRTSLAASKTILSSNNFSNFAPTLKCYISKDLKFLVWINAFAKDLN